MNKPILSIAFVLVLLVACTPTATPPEKTDVQSLRGDVALDTTSSEPPALEWKEGGPPLQKSFAQQPPMIPHSVGDYAITLQGNDCMGCHEKPEATGAIALPDSHFRDRDGKPVEKLAARRYFCTQCHAAQKEAMPLVKNSFNP